jgi:hypothetical protein
VEPLHEIVETPIYLAAARRAGMDEDDREFVASYIAANPQAGDLIKGSNGVRKVRIAKPDTGKSGGWRVLTAYVADIAPVYLLTVYAKNRRANISQAEVNAWAKVMTELKAEARKDEG